MKRRIKILYTIPNFDTAGSGKALLKVAMGLDRTLFEPHIACFHDRGAFFETVRRSGISVHLIEYTSPSRPLMGCLKACYKKSHFFKQFDIIHSYHYAPDYTEGLAVRMAGRKFVFTKKNMNWGGSSARGWLLRSFLANRIAVQNRDMIREFYPKSKKVFYLTRGVDTREFQPREKDRLLLKELGLPVDAKIVLNVSNMVPVKGLEVLMEAFAGIEDPKARLLLVGDNDNDYGRFLGEKARELNIVDRVIFTGKRSDVNRFLSIADLFVLPTLNKGRKEGSPVALLEAMASGRIVLASDIAGISDQLDNFQELMFEAGNVDQLKAKMKWVLEMNTDDLSAYKSRLLEEVNLNFTIEKEIARHEELYKLLIHA